MKDKSENSLNLLFNFSLFLCVKHLLILGTLHYQKYKRLFFQTKHTHNE